MSTEVKITPYEGGENRNQGSDLAGDIAVGAIGLAAGAAIGVAVGCVKLAVESLMLDEKQKEALAKLKEEERKERGRLKETERLELIAVPLKLRTSDTLVKSAANLGFKLQTLEVSKTPSQSQQSIILTRLSGETLTLKRGEAGRLVIETPLSNVSIIQEVVQRHTIDQAISHLKKQCKSVEIKKGRSGDYLIVAQEGNRGQKDGDAMITTHISNNGLATVDVSNIKGKRCEEIINGIARAIGGECVKSKKKKEYFQVSAEQKENIRV